MFCDLQVETIINDFSTLQSNLEQSMPRLALFEDYIIDNKGEKKFNITKGIRNIAFLDNFQACLFRLHEFCVAVEFFQGKIRFERNENDFPIGYKQKLFITIAADSLRSALDIYAKSIAWFYDLKNKETLGYSYQEFLKPLKEFSVPIFREANSIYQSKPYQIIKDLRDSEKHSGLGKRHFKLIIHAKKFEAEVKNPEPLNLRNIESSCCDLLTMLMKLMHVSTKEIIHHKKSFVSKNDKFAKLDNDGRLIGI
jgi:hypothetical protein